MRYLVLASALLAIVLPALALAKDEATAKEDVPPPPVAAKLQLYPTRIILKDGKDSAEVNVVNGGTATGRYRAEMADMQMLSEGPLKRLGDGEEMPYSIKSHLRVSPRSVTVPPGQSQKFRLLLRKPRDMADGEYRTHLHVMMSSDNVENESAETPDASFGVKLRPRLQVSIPVIVVVGAVNFSATIDDMQLVPASEGISRPGVMATMSVSGNASSWGRLVVTFTKAGQTYEVYHNDGYTIYRDVKGRKQRLALELPEGVELSGGVLKLTYSRTEEDGGALIAERELVI